MIRSANDFFFGTVCSSICFFSWTVGTISSRSTASAGGGGADLPATHGTTGSSDSFDSMLSFDSNEATKSGTGFVLKESSFDYFEAVYFSVMTVSDGTAALGLIELLRVYHDIQNSKKVAKNTTDCSLGQA